MSKHQWIMSDGEVDIFQFDQDYHNGPRCKLCDRTECHHCYPKMYDEECPVKETTRYCATCGERDGSEYAKHCCADDQMIED